MIENELCYVLNPELGARLSSYAEMDQPVLISQGWHGKGGRIRSQKSEDGTALFTFNYKIPHDGSRCEEFEMEIDEEVFYRNWEYTTVKLLKVRHTLNIDPVRWDIDFFLSPGMLPSIYFCMAECELPEDMDEPTYVPDVIKQNLIYKPKPDELRGFTSRKLADEDYARNLLERISS